MSQTLGCVRNVQLKSNDGRYIDRFPQIRDAGYSTYTPTKMKDILQTYNLQDEVDALLSKVVVPEPSKKPVFPLSPSRQQDMRHCGYYGEIRPILAPPMQTKFQTLVEDLKETVYDSYWKKPLGHGPCRASMLPVGFDYNKPFGKKTPEPEKENIIFPVIPTPVHERFRLNHECSIQTRRNYCEPPYNPNIIFGQKTNQDRMGTAAKCCLTYSNALAVPVDTIKANYKHAFEPKLGMALTPNENLKTAGETFTFGDQVYDNETVATRITLNNLRKEKRFLTKCLKHINSVRRSIFKVHRDLFFPNFYLNLKYYDKSMSGWLEKEIVYDKCLIHHIRFHKSLIEPLLQLWKYIDGSQIQYQGFCNVLNHTVPLPDLPKIMDVDESCLDYTTTYREMAKPNREVDSRPQAGKPSAMYFVKDYPVTPDFCCAASRTYLPQESDATSNLVPSIFTQFGVTHREMFANRDRKTVRRVFEAVEEFTDELFDAVWDEATKYHSKGLVCYETFRKALKTIKDRNRVQVDKEDFVPY